MASTTEDNQKQQPPPAKRQKKELKYESSYLRSIPRASQYEKSFMHRDIVTHVFSTERDFLITASQDGHLKFWKKQPGQGVEFVKHFRCHLKAFSDIGINHNGTLMATCCVEDKSVKVFDVANFDMINMFRLEFHPRACCWVHTGSDLVCALAISDANSGRVYIFDGRGGNEPIKVIEEMHSKPVIMMDYNARVNVAVSIDEAGMVEYWSGTRNDYAFPSSDTIDWEYKTDTDLYEFAKIKQVPKCLKISPNGQLLTIVSSDRTIYIFNLRKAKIVKKLDETLQHYIELGKENKGHGLQNVEWNRRVALEKELSRDPSAFRYLSIAYDESSNFLIYPTPLGIRVYNLVTDEVVREIGKGENIRFTGVALCRALPGVTEKLQGAATSIEVEAAENPNLRVSEPDPMIITCAHKKNRFYIFTNVEPFTTEAEDGEGSSRDIFNERPEKSDSIAAVAEDAPKASSVTGATIHTSYGDVHVHLFSEKAPKAVENWTTLARRGYYNGHQFHRVIKAFMIQTGDPTGKGTGGQSIWGSDFDDEFHPSLNHEKPYRLSMANAGPHTNGSQFFITVVPAPWLDGKHTIFGEVTEGFNVVQKINQVPTYPKTGRPKEEISVISITLKD